MTKLTAFVLRIGGELTIECVLAPRTIDGFLRSQPVGARDEEPLLWRLAQAYGTVAPDAPVQVRIGRRAPKPPYSAAEIDALMLAARTGSAPNSPDTGFEHYAVRSVPNRRCPVPDDLRSRLAHRRRDGAG